MRITALVSVMSAAVMVSTHAFGQQFISFDVACLDTTPVSACPAGLAPGQTAAQTSAKGINARGDIVGVYSAGGIQHGFLLRDGTYTSLDFPIPGVRATSANGINARGEIVGQYTLPVRLTDDRGNLLSEDSPLYCPPNLPSPPPLGQPDPACIKAFHYWQGAFSTLMFPSTVDEHGQQHKHPGAIAQRITPDGDVYGCLHDHDLGASMFGAAWTHSGAFSLTFDGGEVSDAMATPMSMNNGATPGGGETIVGFAMDMRSNQQRGFRVRNGMLEWYDPTAASAVTAIWDINPGQQFVGTYREFSEPTAARHGFLQAPDLETPPVTFDFTCQDPAGCAGAPLGTVAFVTIAFGINPQGVIVGQYQLVAGGTAHGFVAVLRSTN